MEDNTIIFITLILVSPLWGLLYISYKAMISKQAVVEKKYIIETFGAAFDKIVKFSEEMKFLDSLSATHADKNKAAHGAKSSLLSGKISHASVDGIIEDIIGRGKDNDGEPLPPKPFTMPSDSPKTTSFVVPNNHNLSNIVVTGRMNDVGGMGMGGLVYSN